MKKYTLSAIGNVTVGLYDELKVDGVKLIDQFAESFGLDKKNYDSKQFAGKVEIIVTDFTEPLTIDTSEFKSVEGCDDVCGVQAKPM